MAVFKKYKKFQKIENNTSIRLSLRKHYVLSCPNINFNSDNKFILYSKTYFLFLYIIVSNACIVITYTMVGLSPEVGFLKHKILLAETIVFIK